MKKNYDFEDAKRGAVLKTPPGKTRITIRIDDDLLEWFRKRAHESGGGNYQTMINQALRDYVDREAEDLEDTLRRVLQEILPGSTSKTKRRSKRKAKGSRSESED